VPLCLPMNVSFLLGCSGARYFWDGEDCQRVNFFCSCSGPDCARITTTREACMAAQGLCFCDDNCRFGNGDGVYDPAVDQDPDGQRDSDDDLVGDLCDTPCPFCRPGLSGYFGDATAVPFPGGAMDVGCLADGPGCGAILTWDGCRLGGQCTDPLGGEQLLIRDLSGIELFRASVSQADLSGAAVALPDLDGDGLGDFAVGAPTANACDEETGICGAEAGEVLIVGTLSRSVIRHLATGNAGARFGEALATNGTVLYVGAPRDARADGVITGTVYVYDLQAGVTVVPMGRVDGDDDDERLGAALSVGSRFGLPVVLAGAPHANGPAGPWAGRIVVLDGSSPIQRFEGPWAGARMGGESTSLMGSQLSGVVAGIPGYSDGAGAVVLFDWASGAVAWQYLGAPGEQLGASVSPPIDLDHDGSLEVVVGAPRANSGNGRIVALDSFGLVRSELVAPGGFGFGSTIAVPGDLTGDGAPDLAITFEGIEAGLSARYLIFASQ